MNVGTIIARNYLPHARTLAESFHIHHPAGRFIVLVVDATPEDAWNEPFEVVTPYDIGLARTEVHKMAMIYDIKEFSTAVKPWLLGRILAGSADHAVYFDPDIQVFSPLDDIVDLSREHGIVLTPHTTDPLPRDNLLPSEKMILQAGVYNLGFIAVGPEAGGFLEWWQERLVRDCLNAVESALFVDQRWIDFAPALFDHHILRDPGCNVAYWNLHTRELRWDQDRYEVDGKPLRFFHFSGYSPDHPELLSLHMGRWPRILLSEHPHVARLCDEYRHELIRHGYPNRDRRYRFEALPSGVPIDPIMRELFRDALLAAENDGAPEPPDPFEPATADDFVEWLRDPSERDAGGSSRYLRALYDRRPDLQAAFPEVGGRDRKRFLQWAMTAGRQEVPIPPVLLTQPNGDAASNAAPEVAGVADRLEEGLRGLVQAYPALRRARPVWRALRRMRTPVTAVLERQMSNGDVRNEHAFALEIASKPQRGINLVGYLRAELGIGEVARKLTAAVELAGIEVSPIVYERTVSRQNQTFTRERERTAPYDTNILCVNADQLSVFAQDVGPEFFTNRYSVGVWFWEISTFPPMFHRAFDFIDEVWVASEFVRETIAAETTKPVRTVPVPIEAPPEPTSSRADLGLPDGFLFLFSFDFLSVFERKNPVGVVEAFTRAFEPEDGAVLVIKSINGDKNFSALERLRTIAGGRADIHILDGYVSTASKDAITAACDCYVSLHRSEGFGLTMAEALTYAKPVIATAYSGNLEFMNDGNSYLVPYRLSKVPEGCAPYPVGAEWADPDIGKAAELMRRVFDRPAEARELGRRAREDVLSRFTVNRTAAFISRRITEIGDAGNRERGRVTATSHDPVQRAPVQAANAAAALDGTAPTRSAVKRRVRRLLRRAMWPYIAAQHELNATIAEALAALARVDDDNLQALGEYRAKLSVLEAQLATLDEYQAKLSVLEAQLTTPPYLAEPALFATTDPDGRPTIGYHGGSEFAGERFYRGFEDLFRGSEEFIRDRQRVYLELVRGRQPVLDAGCGRGEFLDLMRECGIVAHGVDLDAGMVARCRERGHDVEQIDAVEYLERQPDAKLGVVLAAQMIEHLSYDKLVRFFELAHSKLAPGGLLVAETVNPHSITAFKAFWVDPTHKSPIFPEVAVGLCRLTGFESAFVVFPNGTGELERDRRTEGEYAVVAEKGEARD